MDSKNTISKWCKSIIKESGISIHSYNSHSSRTAPSSYAKFHEASLSQDDLTPRIYVLHKITIALKFMSYINQKLQPSYQTAINLFLTWIENFGKKCTRKSGAQLETSCWWRSLIVYPRIYVQTEYSWSIPFVLTWIAFSTGQNNKENKRDWGEVAIWPLPFTSATWAKAHKQKGSAMQKLSIPSSLLPIW